MFEQSNQIENSQILIVEDVTSMRLYLRMALEKGGAIVTEAGDLKQAREALRSSRPFSVLLLDLDLPDGNGLDLVREASAHTRVIALSADDSQETVLRCHEAGCHLLVQKGRGPSELRKLLKDIGRCVAPSSVSSKEQDELANRYLEFLSESRVTMQWAWHHRDFKTLRSVTHRLRGTAIHFGYASVGAGARVLGDALAVGDVKQVNERINKLAEKICDAVEVHYLKTNGPRPMEDYICES